jgi:hypothetical protein
MFRMNLNEIGRRQIQEKQHSGIAKKNSEGARAKDQFWSLLGTTKVVPIHKAS